MLSDDLEQLKRIIALCRKSGIKSIELGDVSIVFDEKAPLVTSKYKKKQEKTSLADTGPFETDALSEHELLFWSTGAPIDGDTTKSE